MENKIKQKMIGDVINIKPEYKVLSKSIYNDLRDKKLLEKDKKVIAVGGESGSGKSVTAIGLSQLLTEKGITNQIIHQDDYFILPPKSNHNNRLKSLDNVGVHEVKMDLLTQHITDFKNGKTKIEKPLVKYQENMITTETLSLKDTQVLILEGTYVLNLKNTDFNIFIDRNYKDTLHQRLERNRDIIDDFANHVLEIEHQIIKQFKYVANGIINKIYEYKNIEL